MTEWFNGINGSNYCTQHDFNPIWVYSKGVGGSSGYMLLTFGIFSLCHATGNTVSYLSTIYIGT